MSSYHGIVDALEENGLQLVTCAYQRGTDGALDADLSKYKHNIDSVSELTLHDDMSNLVNYQTDRPQSGKSVTILIVDPGSDLIVGLYDFDLGANFSDDDREAAGDEAIPADLAVLGLKWIHADYRSQRVFTLSDEQSFTVNMAMTEIGWQIMEKRAEKAWTLCATTAGEKSARNAGMQMDGI